MSKSLRSWHVASPWPPVLERSPALIFSNHRRRPRHCGWNSVPPGAEVKVAGQSCRTPCELTLPVADISASFALKGYQRQTIVVHSEGGGVFSTAKFAPNPVHADLQRGVASAQPRTRSKTAVAKPHANSTEAPDPSAVPEETLLPSYANAR